MRFAQFCFVSALTALIAAPLTAGSVKGKVNFDGKAPSNGRPIQMNADPNCVAANEGKKVFSERYVVADDGGMRDVFVYVKEGLDGKTFDPPADPVVFDQKGCTYHPHVFGIMVGQTLKIHNSDPTLHNVHIIPDPEKGNAEANISTPFQGFELERKFEKPETMVTIKCDVHKWMEAYCGVMTHPFFATTAADGSYEIKDLPAGKYKLAFWHKRLGEKVFDIDASADVEQNLTYTPDDVPKRKPTTEE